MGMDCKKYTCVPEALRWVLTDFSGVKDILYSRETHYNPLTPGFDLHNWGRNIDEIAIVANGRIID